MNNLKNGYKIMINFYESKKRKGFDLKRLQDGYYTSKRRIAGELST
jgi:hypothetical protein